ncbi:MAG: metal-dependent hydrolase [Bacillota bacterium]
MTGYTHAAAGAFAGALAGKLTGDPIAGLAVGAVAALLPDIDHPGSLAGRRLRPLAVLLELFAGHRTVTHTFWFCLLTGLIFGLLSSFLAPAIPSAAALLHLKIPLIVPSPWEAGLFALLGGLSHLALDACTRSGVSPFAPLSLPGKLARLEHIKGPLKTGDPLTEWPACLLFAAAAFKATGVL